ncbi:MAG: ATP-binding cassette domain-containing protein, partial [Burkholderiales bacterium]
MENIVQIENVEMTFTTKSGEFPALAGISLTVNQGDFVTLIGHSGCGKSTLLNLIAGLITPTHGHIFVNGREVAGPGPDR